MNVAALVMQVCFGLLLMAGQAWAESLPVGLPLEMLSDEDLGELVGQEGIALSYESRINASADGNPLSGTDCPTVGALTGGTSCRMGLNPAAREGAWIVLKGYRMILAQKDLYLGDADLPNAASPYRDITTHMGGYNPNDKPAFQVTIGNFAAAGCDNLSAGSCTAYLNSASYNDMTLSYVIESMTAEYDTASSPGYLNNNNSGAPISFRIARGVELVPDPNNPPDVMLGPYGNAPAQIRWDGYLQLHGFGQ